MHLSPIPDAPHAASAASAASKRPKPEARQRRGGGGRRMGRRGEAAQVMRCVGLRESLRELKLASRTVDLLSIDIEGNEPGVLRCLPWHRCGTATNNRAVPQALTKHATLTQPSSTPVPWPSTRRLEIRAVLIETNKFRDLRPVDMYSPLSIALIYIDMYRPPPRRHVEYPVSTQGLTLFHISRLPSLLHPRRPILIRVPCSHIMCRPHAGSSTRTATSPPRRSCTRRAPGPHMVHTHTVHPPL